MTNKNIDPQRLAERCRDAMHGNDAATHGLGIEFEAVGPGYAKLAMVVQPHMVNGHMTCHGGYITALADSAFAFACNSRNAATVASGLSIEFLAPGHKGDRLVAEAKEVCLKGVTGVYDVTVHNEQGTLIAVMRGKSHHLKGRYVIPPEEL